MIFSFPKFFFLTQKNFVFIALIFLTHFVGDIHQPLHCMTFLNIFFFCSINFFFFYYLGGYGYDEGGNLVKIFYYSLPIELHYIWDNTMIQNYTMSNVDYKKLADGIRTTMKQYPEMVDYYYNNMDVILWANESFDYVRNTCYVFSAKDVEMRKNSFQLDSSINKDDIPHLGDWYLQRNLPVIFQRLTGASVRLAHLLSEIFGTNKGKNLHKLLNIPQKFKN